MFKASIAALVTPMHTDGSFDESAFNDLIEWHIAEQTDGFVIAGTTGEAATLTIDEHYRIVAHTVQQVAGRVPVIAGTGTNSTATTLQLTDAAKKAKADACLIVTPYYNKPTQNGLYVHYKTVVETIDFPTILYNVPSRTSCDILPETVERLAKIKQIIGIKDATGDLRRATEIRERCGKEFLLFSGDDPSALGLLTAGIANGVISVTANVAPRKMHAMCEAALNQNTSEAQRINQDLMPLHKTLFIESNPIPTKWALFSMQKIKLGIRLPLLPLDKQYHEEVKQAMQKAGVK